jgi:hypothetical protein
MILYGRHAFFCGLGNWSTQWFTPLKLSGPCSENALIYFLSRIIAAIFISSYPEVSYLKIFILKFDAVKNNVTQGQNSTQWYSIKTFKVVLSNTGLQITQ